MKATKGIPLWAFIIGLLRLANLGWMSWNLCRSTAIRAAYKDFRIEILHTNGLSGVGIFETKTEQPLWTEFSQDGKPAIENYFFQGKDVFDITFSSNSLPKYGVFFRGPEKSETWWLDRRGIGSFTERIFYDTNGNFFNHEIWYNQAWQTVDKRNETNGIVINGQWFRLKFDTNNNWAIDSINNQPSK